MDILNSFLELMLLASFFRFGKTFKFDSFQSLRLTLMHANQYEYASIPAQEAHKYTHSGKAVDASLRVVLSDVRAIHEQGLEVIVHLQAGWVDNRLSFNASSMNHNYTVARTLMDKLWTPDIYLEPEWDPPDSETRVIRLFPDGHVLTSVRVHATFPCDMKSMTIVESDWICSTKISSYAYDADELELTWYPEDAIVLQQGLSTEDSHITAVRKGTCKWDTFNELRSSCLQVDITVRKTFKSVIVRLYVPSFMASLMAWSSFWIHRDEVSARIKLATLVVMTVMTEYVTLELAFPQYLQYKAGNVWMMGCMTFTWASFFLFIFIHVARRREKAREKQICNKRKAREEEEKKTGQRTLSVTSNHPEGNMQSDLKGYSVWDSRPKVKWTPFVSSFQLDRLCRIWYGVSFLIFNLFFWIYFGVAYSGGDDSI